MRSAPRTRINQGKNEKVLRNKIDYMIYWETGTLCHVFGFNKWDQRTILKASVNINTFELVINSNDSLKVLESFILYVSKSSLICISKRSNSGRSYISIFDSLRMLKSLYNLPVVIYKEAQWFSGVSLHWNLYAGKYNFDLYLSQSMLIIRYTCKNKFVVKYL